MEERLPEEVVEQWSTAAGADQWNILAEAVVDVSEAGAW